MRRACAIGAGALALALAGCGGGDDDEGFAPVVADPIDKVEFLREADAICRSGDARIEAAADGPLTRGEPTRAEIERLARSVVVPALEAEVRAIAAIPVPEGDEREVERIIAATERGIAEIARDPAALADGPTPGLREAGRLSRAYGSSECGAR